MGKGRRFALLAGGAAAGAWWLRGLYSAPGYEGPESDHFDGTHFRNLDPVEHGTLEFVKWRATAAQGEWPKWIDAAPGPKPPPTVAHGPRITWINHATVLIQLAGLNVLTDPIWSYRCSPVDWAGPRRHRAPGIRFGDLPKIDLVLISHNHYDHLDLPTLRLLAQHHQPRFVTGLGNRRLLNDEGITGVDELDWWESTASSELELTFLPARHFSSRGLSDRNRTLWGGYSIRGRESSVYFAGDTGMGSHFDLIRERIGSPDVALLPIGAYLPRWFMSPVHLGPDEAVSAHEILGAGVSIPIHWGTFPLGDDGHDEPVDLLRRELGENDSRFAILEPGDFWEGVTGAG